MELRGQAAQEPRTRSGPIGGPVIVGAVSPIRAGRRDFAVHGIQGPADAAMPALRGTGAGPPAAVHLVDHAAGGAGRIGAIVIVPDGEGVSAALGVDGVAGTIGDDEHHLRVAGVQIVIAPADGPTLRSPRLHVADLSGRPHRQAVAGDLVILRGNQSGAIGLLEELAAVAVRKAVVTG